MNHKNGSSPATKDDLEIAIAQIANAVVKSLENVATKDDLKQFATKDDLKQTEQRLENRINSLENKVDNLTSDVTDIKRRVIDLEHDTPTQKEVDDLKHFVGYTGKP